MLNFCKKLNVYIANSRVGEDLGKGEKTCKDTSVVDYLLLSSSLFLIIQEFKIEEFEQLYSDCHYMIHVVFQGSINTCSLFI